MKKIEICAVNIVICDYCDKDYTNREEQGGFLFGSYAVCPDCESGMNEKIKKYDESRFIKGRCPEKTSFRDWILSIR